MKLLPLKYYASSFNTLFLSLGAPSVLFIDEIDGMVTNRDDSESSSGVQERVLSVLLNEMDGIGNNTQSSSREVSSIFFLFPS